jgi:hypothetical protein
VEKEVLSKRGVFTMDLCGVVEKLFVHPELVER